MCGLGWARGAWWEDGGRRWIGVRAKGGRGGWGLVESVEREAERSQERGKGRREWSMVMNGRIFIVLSFD